MSYTNGLDKPSDYFNTKLYTGNGTDAHAITGVGFSPDFVWLKGRSVAEHHTLNDTVRGANKQLFSNLTYGESTETDRLQSFDSDGFTLGTDVIVNQSSQTFVSWNWLASNTTASNTDGSITSTVSANTTSGFSIVSYTGNGTGGATIGHGLGSAPKMFITKSRSSARSWAVYNENIGNTKALFLDTTAVQDTDSTYWNSTSPNSSVLTLGSRSEMNHSGENFIAYCFAEKKGFSKFGSYTGNGNADGTFIYTGFKPAFVMIKVTSTTGNWVILDNKRSDVSNANVNDQVLYPNLSNAELSSTTRAIDTVSNGFKCRGDGGNINASGSTYIYMAFAENPFVTSGGIPTTAR